MVVDRIRKHNYCDTQDDCERNPSAKHRNLLLKFRKRGDRYGYQCRHNVSDQNEYQRWSESEDHLLVRVRRNRGSNYRSP